jgi:hypothetical protein
MRLAPSPLADGRVGVGEMRLARTHRRATVPPPVAPPLAAETWVPHLGGDDAMKWRTSVLITALVVVPLVAAFSHLVPRAVRRAASARLWQPVREGILALLDDDTDAGSGVPTPVATEPTTEAERRSESLVAVAPVALPPAPLDTPVASSVTDPRGTATPAAVAAVSFTSSPAPESAVALPTEAPAPRPPASPQVVADALVASTRGSWAPHLSHTRPSVAPDLPTGFPATRAAAERHLAELGAVGFDFTPADAACPRHRCSCRLPADPSGQLQRVFQAADENPEVALGQLLTEVKSWQRRSLATAPPTAPAARGGTVRR